jgi:phenylacetate-coenzyme A ligase PaaK-like adenylate-forming protein
MTLYESRSETFYDVWESLPDETRLTEQSARLARYIEHARKQVNFYGERLSGFAPKETHPLLHIPVLNPADLRPLLPPCSNDLLSQHTTAFSVFQSGGTTGMPKTTLFSHDELEGLNLPNARGFFAVGLTPEDRVANLWAVGGLYMTFVHINRMLQSYGCTSFPFSNKTPFDFVHTVVKAFEVNCLSGIGSVVLNYLRSVPDADISSLKIRKVFFGGEHMYPGDKQEICSKFGVETIAAPGYGTVDSWYIGYQCSNCQTGEFHVHDDQVYMEIFNEDENRHCHAGEVGLVYVTAFPRILTPIVRYRVGDLAHWIPGKCSCGRQTPRFKLLGRGDDTLRIGFDSIDYNFLQECVNEIAPGLGSIQMEKQREQGKDRLVVRIEGGEQGDFPDRVAASLTAQRPTLREGIANGSVWPIAVLCVPQGSLPRNSRTGKLIRVKDGGGDGC